MTAVYTPRTLADLMGCSERHVRNLIASGELRAFRFGGKLLRITPEAVEDYIQCQTTASVDCAENSASHGRIRPSLPDGDVIALERPTGRKPSASPLASTRKLRALKGAR